MTKVEGGAFGGIDDLYREVILEHFKAPQNKGQIDHPTCKADGMNPLCGDQITISISLDQDRIKDLKFEGSGCAISQSSASMMTAAAKGKSISEAKSLIKAFKNLMGVDDPALTEPALKAEDLGDLQALEGVKKYPVRIKCALLAWNTFLQVLGQQKGQRHG